jgi:hypothetical protein
MCPWSWKLVLRLVYRDMPIYCQRKAVLAMLHDLRLCPRNRKSKLKLSQLASRLMLLILNLQSPVVPLGAHTGHGVGCMFTSQVNTSVTCLSWFYTLAEKFQVSCWNCIQERHIYFHNKLSLHYEWFLRGPLACMMIHQYLSVCHDDSPVSVCLSVMMIHQYPSVCLSVMMIHQYLSVCLSRS